MKKSLWLFIFSLIILRWSPAIAASFMISVPLNSGDVITRPITSFDQRNFTSEEAYNYDRVEAKYNGIVPIKGGTNMFFVDTAEGLSLFMVNETFHNLISQLKYEVTTQGTLLFRDDIQEVDNDPLTEVANPDGTTTFISMEGFRDIGCMNGVCRTDGLVIGLNSKNVPVTWKYDPVTFPLINIEMIHFWSPETAENFSVDLGTALDQFDPSKGVVEAVPFEIPELSSIWGLLSMSGVMLAFHRRK